MWHFKGAGTAQLFSCNAIVQRQAALDKHSTGLKPDCAAQLFKTR